MARSGPLSGFDVPPSGPWFRVRPMWAVLVAAALYLGVFVLRISVGDAHDAINMLYALPVGLIALTFGRSPGLLAGCVAFLLVWLWTVVDSVDLTAIGWVSRIVPLVLLGGLLGDASERLVAGQQRERALEIAAQRHRDATEVNDTLVQGMASAKWSLEAGRHEAGLTTLTQTLELGHQLVSRLLRDADMGPNGHRPPPRD